MALSNVACLLAERNSEGKGVLMIDWDLEAPGLHRFFHDKFQRIFVHTTDPAQALEERPGLIDLFLKLDAATPESGASEEENEKIAYNTLNNIKLEEFIVETDIPNLSLLKAGRFDENFSNNVNTFDWEGLFNRSPSLIRLFAERLTEQYSYVLIDSRTGYTDISGICTMLMPQKLVVVFTPNRQSHTGIKDLVKQATDYRRQSDDLRPLLVYPLPSRIEFSRDDLRADWRFGNPDQNIEGYQPMFENLFKEVYELRDCKLEDYFEDVQIQQSPNYAYGEEIAVKVEKTEDRFSLTSSYKTFTEWLLRSTAPWQRTIETTTNALNISAQRLYDKGMYEQAFDKWKEVLNIDQKNQFALEGIETINKRTIEKINTLNISAQRLYDKSSYEQASDKWKEVLNIDPKNQIALKGLNKIYRTEVKKELTKKSKRKFIAIAIAVAIVAATAATILSSFIFTPQPQLYVNPDTPSFNFDSMYTGETADVLILMANSGGGTLTWNISDDQPWINVNPTNGTYSEQYSDIIIISVNSTGLSPGNYSGTITINSSAGSKTGYINLTVVPEKLVPEKPVKIVFDKFPDGTPINTPRVLKGYEFLSYGIFLSGAPESSYCANATSAAIRLSGTYNIPFNFLTTARPNNITSCNFIPVAITFTEPVRNVTLTFAGASTTYNMKVYDSKANLLGTVQKEAILHGGTFEITFNSTSTNIEYITFGRQAALTAIKEIYYER